MPERSTQLSRSLGLGAVTLFGLAYMAPMIVLGIFGVIAETAGGSSASAYLVATVAMLFTAQSYGRMARAYPVAGSAYTYTRRTIDGRVGFLVGWAVMLDYLFLPMVIWLIGASFLQAEFPGVPMWVFVVAFIVLTTVLNVIGIKLATRANFVLMAFQVLVLAVFVAFCIGFVVTRNGGGGLVSAGPVADPGSNVGMVVAGAAIAAYSFLGFDAVTTLTEETRDPTRTIPRAILLTALIGGVVFVLVTYVTQLVHPGGQFADSSNAAFDIAKQIGGAAFGAFFIAGLVITQFASGIAAQASASRLLFAMGRDGVLPQRLFGALNARFHTPVFAIGVSAVVGLIALFLDVATSTSFINFGAFLAFTFVNLSVIAHWARHRADEALNPLWWLVCPAIGALVDLGLLTQLDHVAIIIGLCWLVVGIAMLAWLTGGFRRQPPEMSSEDAADAAIDESVQGRRA